jgi:hypothetical protein
MSKALKEVNQAGKTHGPSLRSISPPIKGKNFRQNSITQRDNNFQSTTRQLKTEQTMTTISKGSISSRGNLNPRGNSNESSAAEQTANIEIKTSYKSGKKTSYGGAGMINPSIEFDENKMMSVKVIRSTLEKPSASQIYS